MQRASFPCPLTDEHCARPECSRSHCAHYAAVTDKAERAELDLLVKLPASSERTRRLLELLGL